MFGRKSAKQSKELLEYLARTLSDHRKRLVDRAAAADEKNAALEAAKHRLESLLVDALDRDSYISLDSLKQSPVLPAFAGERPRRDDYMPAPLSGFSRLLPWKKRAYRDQYGAAEVKYERDLRDYKEALLDHQIQVEQEQAAVDEHNAAIENYKQEFAAGDAIAIANYFELVLDSSAYPSGFPKQPAITYVAESQEVRVEFSLPTPEVIPDTWRYAYDEIRDETVPIALSEKRRRRLYASMLAQISLRAVHEIFIADRTETVDRIDFSGYAEGINPSSGQEGRFCLVTLSVTRRQFESLDLRRVDPLACVKGLGARLSSKPDQLLAVFPSGPADQADAQAVDAADGPQAGQPVSELKSAIQAQGDHIAELERKLEAYRDRIAKLQPELRDEQERNAELQIEIQVAKSYIVDLESRLEAANDDIAERESVASEDTEDTQPVEPAGDIAAGGDFIEAGMFAPIAAETADESAGGVPVLPREGEADGPVALRDLLQGNAKPRADSVGKAIAPATSASASYDLRDCINCLGKAEAKLLMLMMNSAWQCSESSVQSAFSGQPFIRPIIDNINDDLFEVIGENLIEEDGAILAVGEEYQAALAAALKLTNNPYLLSEGNRQ